MGSAVAPEKRARQMIYQLHWKWYITVLFVYWKTQNFSEKYNILPFEKCAEHE